MRKLLLFFIMLFLTLYAFAPTLGMFRYVHEKKQYFPQHASESGKAHWIKLKLESYVKHPAYQKNRGRTYCNVFARDVLDDRKKNVEKYCFFFSDFHYNITPIFPKKNNIYMSISKAYKKAFKAEKNKLIISLTAKQAQIKSNKGKLIWGISKKFNHEFLVCPGEWSDSEGCWVAQAGEVNGIFRISANEVFRKNWQDKDIKFYEFEEVICYPKKQ